MAGAPRGQRPEQERGHDRKPGRSQQDGPAHVHLPKPRQAGRRNRQQESNSGKRQHDAERSSGCGKHQAIHHRRPHNPLASRAQCRPHCDLAFAGDRSCQLKVREVHTANQQHGCDRGQQEPQRRAYLAGNLFLQRFHHDRWMSREMSVPGECLLEPIQFALRLHERNS